MALTFQMGFPTQPPIQLQMTGSQGPAGAAGENGTDGAPGATGATGPPGPTDPNLLSGPVPTTKGGTGSDYADITALLAGIGAAPIASPSFSGNVSIATNAQLNLDDDANACITSDGNTIYLLSPDGSCVNGDAFINGRVVLSYPGDYSAGWIQAGAIISDGGGTELTWSPGQVAVLNELQAGSGSFGAGGWTVDAYGYQDSYAPITIHNGARLYLNEGGDTAYGYLYNYLGYLAAGDFNGLLMGNSSVDADGSASFGNTTIDSDGNLSVGGGGYFAGQVYGPGYVWSLNSDGSGQFSGGQIQFSGSGGGISMGSVLNMAPNPGSNTPGNQLYVQSGGNTQGRYNQLPDADGTFLVTAGPSGSPADPTTPIYFPISIGGETYWLSAFQ